MNETKWRLADNDLDLLIELVSCVRSLVPLATAGNHLLAIGEVWDGIERIQEGTDVETSTEVSVEFRRRDAEFKEGRFLSIRVNEDEIGLDGLNTTYSEEEGFDHFSRLYARFTPQGGFDDYGFCQWCDKLVEVAGFDDAQLSTTRDHL